MEEVQSSQTNDNAAIKCQHSAQVDPRLLKPHPLNPNDHPEEQIEMFVRILKYQGWRRPITISKRSGYITKGHGAREAALAAGYTIVPVDFQDYDDEAQELADIVADNQLQRMSTMNNSKLQKIIVELDTVKLDFNLTAIDMGKMNQIMEGVAGWGIAPVPEPSLSVDYQPEQTGQYAEEQEYSGGPAEGEPYNVDHAKLPAQGSKELSKDDFQNFNHKCPRCQFEFDN